MSCHSQTPTRIVSDIMRECFYSSSFYLVSVSLRQVRLLLFNRELVQFCRIVVVVTRVNGTDVGRRQNVNNSNDRRRNCGPYLRHPRRHSLNVLRC